jgi:hypothetical protein
MHNPMINIAPYFTLQIASKTETDYQYFLHPNYEWEISVLRVLSSETKPIFAFYSIKPYNICTDSRLMHL